MKHSVQRTMTGLALLISSVFSFQALAAGCNPSSSHSCGLPFPSDVWSVDDPNSPTGKRLQVPDSILPASVLAELPTGDGVTPAEVFAGSSGFSAAGAVVFEFSAMPDAASIPADGGDMVVAIDLTTGQRVPVRAHISPDALARQVDEPSFVMEIFPRSRWAYGHEILVVVTDQFPLTSPEPGILSHLRRGDDYVSGLLTVLRQQGFRPRQVLNATRFTVRDRDEVVVPMLTAIERMHSYEHPVRNVAVRHQTHDPRVAAIVRGDVLIHNLRRNNGQGLVDFDAEPLEQWVPFRLMLPAASLQGRAPVALYAHGLGFNRLTDVPVKSLNAELGIANFGIDFPNHGRCIIADGGYVFGILTPEELAKPLGMIQESSLDFASIHRALLTALADLDVVGPETNRSGSEYLPDGVPDLDVSRVMMEGTSLGGVLGATYGAVAPDLQGVVFTVTGAGLSNILSESVLWDAAFKRVMPKSASGADIVLLRALLQQVIDPGDGINYVDYYRYPEAGGAARPLMLTMGEGDGLVGNQATHAMALLADLPVVGEYYVPMEDVRFEDDFDPDGYGIRQYLPLYDRVPEAWDAYWLQVISDASAHFSLLRPGDFEDQQEFIRRFVFPPQE